MDLQHHALQVAAAGCVGKASDADAAFAKNYASGRGRRILRRRQEDIRSGVVARLGQLTERNSPLYSRLERHRSDRLFSHVERARAAQVSWDRARRHSVDSNLGRELVGQLANQSDYGVLRSGI